MRSDETDPGSDLAPSRAREILQANLDRVRQRIARSAAKAGRAPEDIRLVAVTKTVSAGIARMLVELGQEELGESRVPVLAAKEQILGADPPVWHFIGPLQRNKARKCVRIARYIHSVESERLLLHLDRTAGEEGRRPGIFLEVNLSGEKTKHGVAPEGFGRLLDLAREAENLELLGLMTIAPFTEDTDLIRRTFAGLRKLLYEYCPDLPHLSMGMSHDLEIAVEEGATYVRVGTALFEGLRSAGGGT